MLLLPQELLPLESLRHLHRRHAAVAALPAEYPQATVQRGLVSWRLVSAFRAAIAQAQVGMLPLTADAAWASLRIATPQAAAQGRAKAKAKPKAKPKAKGKARAGGQAAPPAVLRSARDLRGSLEAAIREVASSAELVAWPRQYAEHAFTAAYAMLKCQELHGNQCWDGSLLEPVQRLYRDKFFESDWLFWVQYGSWSQCTRLLVFLLTRTATTTTTAD